MVFSDASAEFCIYLVDTQYLLTNAIIVEISHDSKDNDKSLL